jgi:DNA-binding helix-hairpin-helix protein with protein kinase domain
MADSKDMARARDAHRETDEAQKVERAKDRARTAAAEAGKPEEEREARAERAGQKAQADLQKAEAEQAASFEEHLTREEERRNATAGGTGSSDQQLRLKLLELALNSKSGDQRSDRSMQLATEMFEFVKTGKRPKDEENAA